MSNLRTSWNEVKSFRLASSSHLLIQLIKRDFRSRFAGSAFGLAWAILQPLSLVTLYWFVFTIMLPQRAATGNGYVLFLISGLLPWIGFNEGIVRGTTSVIDNAAVVRRLPFRSEILVLVPNASAILFELIAIALFVSFLAMQGKSMRALWLLPFIVVMQLAVQVGIGWFLAAAYVFFRDVTQLLGFFLSILFYLSPIIYPVGGRFEKFFRWNPLTPLLGLFRSAILGVPLPDVASIVFLLVFASVGLATGLLFFRKVQPSLVDLL
ncbi:MAG TPA: ABC transporter permease [Thermoanaerobaculia bacterium]|nr:ABC transporter permease [Thermoanaerobaculia bacterium]